MTTPPEFPAEQPAATPSELADWGTRALGFLIDALPVLILAAVTAFSRTLTYFVALLNFAYFYFYLGNLDGTAGQTPGKRVMGLRLVNQEGNVIGSGAGIARKFAHIIDSLVCFVGWFLPLFDDRRQTIADKMLTTYVVTGVEKQPFSFQIYMP